MTAPPTTPSPAPAPAPSPASGPAPAQVPPPQPRPLARLLDQRVERLRRASTTTPGRFGLIGIGLLLLISVSGLFAALGVAQRSSSMDSLVGQSEPRAAAAQELYRALSDADATASRAFLAAGLEEPDVRERYARDIAQAGAALVTAAGGTADEASGPIAEIATQLPVYTGLVEAARTNNRQDLPLGAAYLREASGLMRERLLPAASEVYRIETAKQNADHDAADDLPVVELLLGLAVIAGLVAAQRYFTRRTNRLVNVGLLAATGAVAVWLLWSMIAVLIQVDDVNDSERAGSAQVEVLVQARIAALEARTDELLTLVVRGAGTEYEDRYVERRQQLGDATTGLLAVARARATDDAVRVNLDSAIRNAQSWQTAHVELRSRDDSGAYRPAVDLAILPTEDSTDTAFGRLEGDLIQAIERTSTAFRTEVADARSSLGGLVAGIVILTLVAAVGAGIGIWQRFREYW
jgi:hypothetical protein